jgi:hypothetical protein
MVDYTISPTGALTKTEDYMTVVGETFLEWLAQEDQERQEKYVMYREYYDGEHEVQLTDRAKIYLQVKDPDADFSINFCPIVVDALAERLKVVGFDAPENGGLEGLFWQWWKYNRMDAQSADVHTAAVRDGDTYIIVGWDNEKGRPEFTHELAYNGTEGVKVHYSQEKKDQIDFASKRWIVDHGEGAGYVRRLNLYYPNRIEKYISTDRVNEGKWTPLSEDDGSWPIPWVDSMGMPLGVPVVHFRHKAVGYNYGVSELELVISPQNALNKMVIDLLAAADTSSFRIYYFLGTGNTDDVEVAPGSIWSMPNTPAEGAIGYMPGEDLRPMIEVVDTFVKKIAQVTRTPLHYFQVSGQMPSEGSQKEQEAGMISKSLSAATHFGNDWENVLYMGRKLHNMFGEGSMDEDELAETIWGDHEIRDKDARNRTRAQAAKILTDAGASLEAALLTVGFTEEEAESMSSFGLPVAVQ